MEQKIQLQHSVGKKDISMNKDKYEVLKKALLHAIGQKCELTHTELLKAITLDFKKNKIKFEGSLESNMEWVKLDLEAKKEIKRVGESPVKFTFNS